MLGGNLGSLLHGDVSVMCSPCDLSICIFVRYYTLRGQDFGANCSAPDHCSYFTFHDLLAVINLPLPVPLKRATEEKCTLVHVISPFME